MNWIEVLTVIGSLTAVVTFLFSYMSVRFNSLDTDVKSAISRIDAAHQRIDQTQAIIMRMLEKQGK